MSAGESLAQALGRIEARGWGYTCERDADGRYTTTVRWDNPARMIMFGPVGLTTVELTTSMASAAEAASEAADHVDAIMDRQAEL